MSNPTNSADVIVHDTYEITAIYLVRPQRYSSQSMGVWFCNAHGMKDDLLWNSPAGQLTKHLIVVNGYNRLPLQPLLDYNEGGKRK